MKLCFHNYHRFDDRSLRTWDRLYKMKNNSKLKLVLKGIHLVPEFPKKISRNYWADTVAIDIRALVYSCYRQGYFEVMTDVDGISGDHFEQFYTKIAGTSIIWLAISRKNHKTLVFKFDLKQYQEETFRAVQEYRKLLIEHPELFSKDLPLYSYEICWLPDLQLTDKLLDFLLNPGETMIREMEKDHKTLSDICMRQGLDAESFFWNMNNPFIVFRGRNWKIEDKLQYFLINPESCNLEKHP